jgi:Domain of unknown function (DUF4258)
MANDDLAFEDIENAIMNGAINRVFKDDPRGARYEIVGTIADDRTVAVIMSNQRNRQTAFHYDLGSL